MKCKSEGLFKALTGVGLYLFFIPILLYLFHPALARHEGYDWHNIWKVLSPSLIRISFLVSLLPGFAVWFLLDRTAERPHKWLENFLVVCLLLTLYDVRPLGLESFRTLAATLRALILVLNLVVFWPRLRTSFSKWKNHADWMPKVSFAGLRKNFFWRGIVFPLVSFSVVFYGLADSWLTHFSTHVFADGGDGSQMVWNVWWFNYALTKLHTNPFFTSYLHFPVGTTLLGATYHPLISLFAVPLIPFLGLVKSFNVLVILSFILSALFAFYLAYGLTQSYAGAWFAGFIYGFCNNHFAHADGHMHVISNQWIPLFLLVWIWFLEKPSVLGALLASLAVAANLFSDYYALLYITIAGGILFVFSVVTRGFAKKDLKPFAVFAFTSFLTSGVFCLHLLHVQKMDPWLGSHSAAMNSLDFLGLLIPGGFWRFAEWTSPYWMALSVNYHEASVHLGFAVLLLTVLGAVRYRQETAAWVTLLILFFVLSLGPYLNVWGIELPLSLPYLFAEKYVPIFQLAGVPARMTFMVTLFAALLVAFAVKWVFIKGNPIQKATLFPLTLILVFEFLPKPVNIHKLEVPGYVSFLSRYPGAVSVLDDVSGDPDQLLYQTVHKKKMAFGYIARLPGSVNQLDLREKSLVEHKELSALCRDYGFKLVVLPTRFALHKSILRNSLVYEDAAARVLDIQSGGACLESPKTLSR